MYESHELLVENGVIICNFSDPQSEEFQSLNSVKKKFLKENGKVGYRKRWLGYG